MDTTIFLAQFWGWLMVIICLAFLLNKKAILAEMIGLVEGKGFSLVSGYVALLLGLVTILLHNVWVADWTVIVTIFGWLSLIKGIVRISLLGGSTSKVVAYFKKNDAAMKIALLIGLFLGAYLIFMSY